MAQRQIYMAQCMCGHVWEIPFDSPLELRAIQCENKGRIDAVCISCDDCNQCHEEAQMKAESDRERYGYALSDILQEW